jgi:hypothetical protein
LAVEAALDDHNRSSKLDAQPEAQPEIEASPPAPELCSVRLLAASEDHPEVVHRDFQVDEAFAVSHR